MRAVDAIRDWWLTNARIRHGHPPGTPTTSAARGWAGPLAGIAALAASGGLGFVASQWAEATRSTAVEREVAEPDATEGPSPPGSLYQYLEDNGYHLPE